MTLTLTEEERQHLVRVGLGLGFAVTLTLTEEERQHLVRVGLGLGLAVTLTLTEEERRHHAEHSDVYVGLEHAVGGTDEQLHLRGELLRGGRAATARALGQV